MRYQEATAQIISLQNQLQKSKDLIEKQREFIKSLECEVNLKRQLIQGKNFELASMKLQLGRAATQPYPTILNNMKFKKIKKESRMEEEEEEGAPLPIITAL